MKFFLDCQGAIKKPVGIWFLDGLLWIGCGDFALRLTWTRRTEPVAFKTATALGTIIPIGEAALRHGHHRVVLAVQHLVSCPSCPCDAQFNLRVYPYYTI